MNDWRNDPHTEKQLNLILEMHEFSEIPLPEYTGKTKGDAADFINKWISTSHERIYNIRDDYGDIV